MKKIVGTSVPIFSLKSRSTGPDAGGTFAAAMVFLDWLAKTGQSAWQFLPLSQTHLEPGSRDAHVPSPYKGYGVGFDPRYLAPTPREAKPDPDELRRFSAEHGDWLPDYALFCALRDRFGTDDWTTWPSEVRRRRRTALGTWRAAVAEGLEHHVREQWLLHRSFGELRERARSLGITLIGDLPFYLPLRSPLVWAHQRCFDLDGNGHPRRVSGVPEGPKSHFGRQVWGHPLYRWVTWRRREIVALWKTRLAYHSRLYDLMRLDHAKGFYYYGAMAPDDPERDAILRGPGSGVLERLVLSARTNGLRMYAEDSGDWRDELHKTLQRLDMPGIRVLRFAYNEKKKTIEHEYAEVANYRENSVAYTSTHDTETLMGYLRLLTPEEKRHLCVHVGVEYDPDDAFLAVRLRGAVLASPAGIVIIPIQDWLLSTERINVPGTEKPVGDANWRYRLPVPIEELPDRLFP